jgi:hypothetical protein
MTVPSACRSASCWWLIPALAIGTAIWAVAGAAAIHAIT